jgi:hypothetical protein
MWVRFVGRVDYPVGLLFVGSSGYIFSKSRVTVTMQSRCRLGH